VRDTRAGRNACALGLRINRLGRTLSSHYDLIVIGAGPAGAAAAVAAAECGLSVLLLDEARAGGGRIHRAPDAWLRESGIPRSVTQEGESLRAELAACGAELAFEHVVWHVGALASEAENPQRFEVSMLAGEVPRQARSRALIVATGALERFYPRPGWTLPGVVGLGAATVMLKASGVLPGERVAVVGPGVLAVSVARLIIAAGGQVVALCDPNPWRAWAGTVSTLVARHATKLARGSAWLATLARARVPIYRGWDVRAIQGERAVESLTLGRVDDRWRPLAEEKTLAADAVCVGYGLASAIDIYQLLGAALRYVPARGGWTPVLDRGQRSAIPGLYGAGDSAGVLGVAAAPATGRIAALSAALDLGRIDAATCERRSAAAHRDLARAATFNSALGRLVEARSTAVGWVPDETIVCRCEDVRAGELRAAIAAGAQEVNALKAATRCGMGPCAGRVCGESAAAFLECAGFSRERIGVFTARAPLRPVPLGMLTGRFAYADIPFPQTADP
jgi:thioredoxin reductase/bacterioferritin-associated ferredoxin